jgi:NAD(P)-dependent dehydrogenase (short-subunit alcohol dehydrogenase family)
MPSMGFIPCKRLRFYCFGATTILIAWFHRGADSDELTEQFRTAMDTNVLSNIHLINLFMPQILKGQAKKVTIISSGMADTDLVNEYEVHLAPVYTMTKAAVNMVTAKFNAIYKKDGVLFLSISPGLVDVGSYGEMAPEKVEALGSMLAKFKTYSPDFAGPSQPEDAAKSVLSVIETSSLAQGHGGAFLSHFGNKQWI